MIVRVGVSMKSMVSEAIYRKALRLSSVAKGSTSTGQLVNIMSSDTNSLLMFTLMITIIMMIPFIVFFKSFFLLLVGYLHGLSHSAVRKDHLGSYWYLLFYVDCSICRYWQFSQASFKYHEHHGRPCETDE